MSDSLLPPPRGEMRAVVVGIAGGTASGKSTLAAAVSAALQMAEPQVSCVTVGMDRFFRINDPVAPRIEFSLLPGEATFDFNHPESTDNAALADELRRLGSGLDADTAGVIIVEGLMTLAVSAVRELCDLRVYVELEDDVRLARRVLRDMKSSRRFTKPEEIVHYYLESARLGHLRHVEPSRVSADLVVRGDGDLNRTARLVAGTIVDLLRMR